MKNGGRLALLAVIALLAAAAIACDPGPPDQSGPEAFIADFVRTLANGWEGRYTAFYLKSSDFNMEREGAQMGVERMTGPVMGEFIRRCATAATQFAGKKVEVKAVHLFSTDPRIVPFIHDVKAQYSNVVVDLTLDGQPVQMHIDELFNTGGFWRLTLFTTVVDTGTENAGTTEIPVQ